MTPQAIRACYTDVGEFFNSTNLDSFEELSFVAESAKVSSPKVGGFLIELLNMDNSLKSYKAMLARFIGQQEADEYTNSFQCEINTFKKAITQLKKFIDFHENNNIPFDPEFFQFLLNGQYFCRKELSLVSYEDENHDNLLWDKEQETLIDDISAIYKHFTTKYPTKMTTYVLDDNFLLNIAFISMQELIKNGKSVKKCKNCGMYFLPTSRSDEKYCDNPSPQDRNMSCKQYGTRRLWYEKQRDDELASLARNIASAKAMLAKRHLDIPEYSLSYEYFKKQRLIWQKSIKNNEKTKDEYRDWLLQMKGQKIIKEAFPDGHN